MASKLLKSLEPLAMIEISHSQRLLIKTRLLAFRENTWVGSRKISWTNIATKISSLPAAPNISTDDRTELERRFQFYSSHQKKRGQLANEKESLEFQVGKDSLIRWYAGQPSRAKKPSDKIQNIQITSGGFVPGPEIVAAIRDFLTVEGYIAKHELETANVSPAFALAVQEFLLGDKTKSDTANQVRLFDNEYLSYERQANFLVESRMIFDDLPSVDLVSVVHETTVVELAVSESFDAGLKRLLSLRNHKRADVCYGVCTSNSLPAVLVFWQGNKKKSDEGSITYLAECTTSNDRVSSLKSLQIGAQLDQYKKFVTINMKYIFDFFDLIDENMGNRLKINQFYGNEMKFNEASEADGGQKLYDEVKRIAQAPLEDLHNGVDFQAPARMIEAGCEVNHFCQDDGQSTLHVIAANGLRESLTAIISNPSLNYLVVDDEGKLPSARAFECGATSMGILLTKKEAKQAFSQKTDIRGILVPDENAP
ncbi:hypothetical protein RLO149_c018800 [Roseobacter litoralis Och 149]|uniref:Uncharacterized protein n=1 Tax=Roseobacter litoralis (strain ATCC 49566 / DSM 6996 / JCM 21268 / NBRC 15278 / OCh 149) TaxID=391595 RepID=F7ZJN7_ROSLO|nr:hypothetical protein RLO149_c018800 [Roseobacter litoralis Och 149]